MLILPNCRSKLSRAVVVAIVVVVFYLMYTVFGSQDVPHSIHRESLYPESTLQSPSPDAITTPDLATLVQDKLAKRLLLVMVITTVEHQKKRDVIRKTWANGYDEKAKTSFDVKFVIGTLLANETQRSSLTAENKEHNDLVLLADHLDTYNNLTRKILQTFLWVDQNEQQYEYVLKIDEDTFARLDVMVAELKKRVNSKGLYWGRIMSTYKPHKGGRWKEDRWFLCPNYLPYAQGGAYLLSSNIIHLIALSANLLTLYNSEDASVGTWVAPFDIERHNDERFALTSASIVKCRNTDIVFHYQTIDAIQKKHEQMVRTGVICPPN